jgi:hypothetical protein
VQVYARVVLNPAHRVFHLNASCIPLSDPVASTIQYMKAKFDEVLEEKKKEKAAREALREETQKKNQNSMNQMLEEFKANQAKLMSFFTGACTEPGTANRPLPEGDAGANMDVDGDA